jgi:hypothetical protein
VTAPRSLRTGRTVTHNIGRALLWLVEPWLTWWGSMVEPIRDDETSVP